MPVCRKAEKKKKRKSATRMMMRVGHSGQRLEDVGMGSVRLPTSIWTGSLMSVLGTWSNGRSGITRVSCEIWMDEREMEAGIKF